MGNPYIENREHDSKSQPVGRGVRLTPEWEFNLCCDRVLADENFLLQVTQKKDDASIDSFDVASNVGSEKTLTVGMDDVDADEVSTKCGKDVIKPPERAWNEPQMI